MTYSICYSEIIVGQRMFDHIQVNAESQEEAFQIAKEVLTIQGCEGLVLGGISEKPSLFEQVAKACNPKILSKQATENKDVVDVIKDFDRAEKGMNILKEHPNSQFKP